MAGQCPPFPPSSRSSFDFLNWVYRHQPCWRQCWHCYCSTSNRLVHSLCHMHGETALLVPFLFPLLKSRGSLLTHWGRFNVNIVAWWNVAVFARFTSTFSLSASTLRLYSWFSKPLVLRTPVPHHLQTAVRKCLPCPEQIEPSEYTFPLRLWPAH